jgi:glycosyltransferase involved in cell wall biosynthesis
MNILFLTRRFYPDIGGVETHVLKVAEQCIRDGHNVTIVTEALEGERGKMIQKAVNWQNGYIGAEMTGGGDRASNTGDLRDWGDKEGWVPLESRLNGEKLSSDDLLSHIIVKRLPKVKEGRVKKFIIWQWFWKHRSLFKDTDIVHCHDVFFWYLPFRLLSPRQKVFITFHGYEGVFPPAKKAVWIRKLSEWLAAGNICVGDYIKKWYRTNADFVTYGGVDLPDASTVSDRQKGDKIHVVMIGRLTEDIGTPQYLQALLKLKKAKFPFVLTVLGDGRFKSALEPLGKVLGFVPEPQKYIREADIVLASSYLSILQALVYGKLVVAIYTNPLKKDYLELAPFRRWIKIVSKNDLNTFFDQYRQNEANYTHSARAGQKWAERQTWKHVASLYYSLWQV